MSSTALVLAAHGSRVEPATNLHLSELARRIAARGVCDEALPAFHHGEPGFAAVLDRLRATDIVVVPVMTSEGYFCDVVLPRELRKNHRYAEVAVHQTPPVGVHPMIGALIRGRIDQLARQFGIALRDACVAIVGHGTTRHARSREATVRLAEQLRAEQEFADVRFAFLDEDPSVETLVAGIAPRDLLVIPFLISGGPHANIDIPTRLGLWPSLDEPPPFVGRIAGRRVICDRAIGLDPAIADIIANLALESRAVAKVALEPSV